MSGGLGSYPGESCPTRRPEAWGAHPTSSGTSSPPPCGSKPGSFSWEAASRMQDKGGHGGEQSVPRSSGTLALPARKLSERTSRMGCQALPLLESRG